MDDCDTIYQVDFSMETDAIGPGAPRLMATCGGDSDEERIVAIHSGGDQNCKQVKKLGIEDMRGICQSRDNKFLAAGDSGGNFFILNV